MNKPILRNTDALSLLADLEDNSIDLILTDPPYGISKKSGFSSVGEKGVSRLAHSIDFGDWDQEVDWKMMDKVMEEYYRVLKRGGTLIMFFDWKKITPLHLLMEKYKFKQRRMIQWVKTNPTPTNQTVNYLHNAIEIGLVGVKVGKPTFHGKYDNGIYKLPKCQDKGRFHPTQKSMALLTQLIMKHSNVDDVVLDTFAGSFSTYHACVATSRNFIGCELNKEYYDKAMDLLNHNQ